jgi:protein gp37
MGDKSKIEWTEASWNPVTGCDKISQGCKFCYAEVMAKRLQAMGQKNYADGFKVTLQPHMLDKPLKWTRPRLIFVNSMSDLFHKDVPLEYIRQVFDVMERASHHTFQVLTKRAERLEELAPKLPWPKNVWMGVSVENASAAFRVDHLRTVPAAVRFLSCEPLIGRTGRLNLEGIHWVIVGGESGSSARPMHVEWARSLRDQCQENGVPFFYKQWGEWIPAEWLDPAAVFALRSDTGGVMALAHGLERTQPGDPVWHAVKHVGRKQAGRLLDGRTWDEMPQRLGEAK